MRSATVRIGGASGGRSRRRPLAFSTAAGSGPSVLVRSPGRRRRPVHGRQDALGRGGQVVDPDAGGVVDGGHHRRARQRPSAARRRPWRRAARRSTGFSTRIDVDARRVQRGRDQVGRQAVVQVAAVDQLDLLDGRVADRLQRAALDLALGQHRVDRRGPMSSADTTSRTATSPVSRSTSTSATAQPSRRPGTRRRGTSRRRTCTPGYGSNCSSTRTRRARRA